MKKVQIGLIDVDNHKKLDKCFPNLPLMKLSAYHKSICDHVEWFRSGKHYDVVYMSKVFSFTPDFQEEIDANLIIKGGTGYAIDLNIFGKEKFHKELHHSLPYKIEHIFPDYGLYGINDTAYGFMSRGCPRGCGFCHVKQKEGSVSYKVADLNEFWNGQKYIELLDPNTFACKDWENIAQQLINSGAWVNFNQGVDIRVMNKMKMEMLKQIKIKHVHFAYDRYQDKKLIEPIFRRFKEETNWKRDKVSVYVLCNYDTTIDQDLDRIMFLKSLDFNPYVMRYDKEHIKRGSMINKVARYVNNKNFFWKYETFQDYLDAYDKGLTF